MRIWQVAERRAAAQPFVIPGGGAKNKHQMGCLLIQVRGYIQYFVLTLEMVLLLSVWLLHIRRIWTFIVPAKEC